MTRALIIKPSGIGDIVHALPVAIALKRTMSDLTLDWLVFTRFADILRNAPFVDDVVTWDRQGGFAEYRRVIGTVRARRYDIVADLQALLRTAFVGLLSGARRRVAVSLARECSRLLEPPVARYDPALHAVERNYQVARHLAGGAPLPDPLDLLPWITLTDAERKTARALLAGADGPTVVFSVGSRGAHKVWPPDRFAALIARLRAAYGISPVFVGSSAEQELAAQVLSRIPCPAINLTGATDLRGVCAVLGSCAAVISNDNGIAHIAAALDRPVLTIFGATNPVWYRPYNRRSTYVYHPLSCAPCDIRARCTTFRCMAAVSVDEVFQAASLVMQGALR